MLSVTYFLKGGMQMIVSFQKSLRKGAYRAAQEFLYGRQQYLREKSKAKGFYRLLLSAPAQQYG